VRGAASAKPSPTTTSLDALAEQALRANWREGEQRDGTPYGYTCPATLRYRHSGIGTPAFTRSRGGAGMTSRAYRALAEAARRDGLREYYDPRDGRGMAARGFGWSPLVGRAGRVAQRRRKSVVV
jgi:hypothetical protein